MTSKARKTVAWAGALLTSALIVGTVATAPFGVADTADQQGTTDAAAIIADADIKSSGEWKDTYPNEFETFMMNDQNVEDVDYNKEFPFLATLYAGNAFSTDYMGARGTPTPLRTWRPPNAPTSSPTASRARRRR